MKSQNVRAVLSLQYPVKQQFVTMLLPSEYTNVSATSNYNYRIQVFLFLKCNAKNSLNSNSVCETGLRNAKFFRHKQYDRQCNVHLWWGNKCKFCRINHKPLQHEVSSKKRFKQLNRLTAKTPLTKRNQQHAAHKITFKGLLTDYTMYHHSVSIL